MKYNEIPQHISGIYKINFPNNKIYIGRAIDIRRRISEHFRKEDNTACYAALHKYYSKCEDIDIDILELMEDYDFKLICEKEKYWIKKYNSYLDKNIGYNNSLGGDGGAYGIENNASKISQSELEEIICSLKKGETNIEIAQRYGVHPDTIGKINQGKTYFNANIDYPIRKVLINSIVKGLDKKNALSKEQYDLIVNLLKTTNKTRQEIAELVNCDVSVISNINTGKHFYCKMINETFPLRQTGRKTIKLSEDEINSIKQDLLDKNLSMIDIANKHKCSRDTIGDINNGRRYRKENETYPIRNFYPKRKVSK